jgi:hypothetical protein
MLEDGMSGVIFLSISLPTRTGLFPLILALIEPAPRELDTLTREPLLLLLSPLASLSSPSPSPSRERVCLSEE